MIELRGVSRAYETTGGTVHALREVDLAVDDASFVAVVGPHGSGKSTLLNILGAIELPTSGSVLVDGEDLAMAPPLRLDDYRRHQVAQVFQEASLFPSLTLLENVRLGAGVAGRPDADEEARGALDAVGLGDRAGWFPARLAPGDQRRVALARALASGNPVVLADDPTGGLDIEAGRAILDLLHREVTDADRAVVMATHDTSLVAPADRVVELDAGRIRRFLAPDAGPDRAPRDRP